MARIQPLLEQRMVMGSRSIITSKGMISAEGASPKAVRRRPMSVFGP